MSRKREACTLDGGTPKKRKRNECLRCIKEIIITHLLRQHDTSTCPMARLPNELIEYIFGHFVGYPVRIHIHTSYSRGTFNGQSVVTVSSTDTIFQVRSKISAVASRRPHLPLIYVDKEGRIDRTLPIHSKTLTLNHVFETERKDFNAFYIMGGESFSGHAAVQVIRGLGYTPPMVIFFIDTLSYVSKPTRFAKVL